MPRRAACLCALAALAATAAWAEPEAPPRPPNVVLFLADDLGWADTPLNGSLFYETPQLERLAREGTQFGAAWATPVCAPSRAELLTGRSAGARLKLVGGKAGRPPTVAERDDPRHRLVRPQRIPFLPPEERTLAEVLREAGYATFFIGKWHLGSGRASPAHQGFERTLEVGSPAVATHFSPYREPLLAPGPPGEYLADRLSAEAIGWLRSERARPFFLYLAHHSVHSPHEAKPELVAKYRAKAARLPPDAPQRNPVMAAMIESLDQSLGRILDALDELGVAERTLVIFLSDNGGVMLPFQDAPLTSNHPLSGGKGSVLEGGIRVPCVLRWPGVARAGVRVDTPVSLLDVFPTVLAAAGLAPPPGLVLDGEDLRPLLTGSGALRREAVFLHHPIVEFASALRRGPLKLIRYWGAAPGGAPRDVLYDLVADPGETRDLAAQRPAEARRLAGLLDAWLEATGALLPAPNPAYRPPLAGAPARER
jgi:arylsulfatase A-like enzyme